MTKKQKIISTLGFLVSFLLIFTYINHEMYLHTYYEKNIEIYSQDYPREYNVLFLGPSTMNQGVSPMRLWLEYGITSYNLANFADPLPTNYWVLINALDQVSTDLVVIDTARLNVPDNMDEKLGLLYIAHRDLDIIPLSVNKLKTIHDIIPPRDRAEFLFPFIAYHSLWTDLDKPTFWLSEYDTYSRGFNISHNNSLAPIMVESSGWNDTTSMDLTDTISKEYLRKIIELCQSRNIEVLLVETPYYTPQADPMINSVQVIAEQYGINFYNMCLDKSLLNFYTDLNDPNHLNMLGAYKTTHALGEYILANYSLDPQKQTATDLWESDYSRYYEEIARKLPEITNLPTYLMMLAAGDYIIDITIYEPVIIEADAVSALWDELTKRCDYLTITYDINNTSYDRADIRFTVSSVLTGETLDEASYSIRHGLTH